MYLIQYNYSIKIFIFIIIRGNIFLKDFKESNISSLKVGDFHEWCYSYYIVGNTKGLFLLLLCFCCCHLYDTRFDLEWVCRWRGTDSITCPFRVRLILDKRGLSRAGSTNDVRPWAKSSCGLFFFNNLWTKNVFTVLNGFKKQAKQRICRDYMWPTKLKIFTVRIFREKFCWLLI